MPLPYPEFPSYTSAERAVDRLVHLIGISAAVAGVTWLVSRLGSGATVAQVAATAVYGFGLIGMLAASAAYNLVWPGRLKARLRRLDHAMIFVMIAGSYTPFAIEALTPQVGWPLCILVWTLATAGVSLKLVCRNRHDVLSLCLYLGMGWLVLGVLRPLWTGLPSGAFLLLISGGIVYSFGSLLHAHARVPFHNAIWHGMVVIAAGLHLAAVAQLSSESG